MPNNRLIGGWAEAKRHQLSSWQFVHFQIPPAQMAKFVTPGRRVTVGVTHPSYGHIAILPEETRAKLAKDLRSA